MVAARLHFRKHWPHAVLVLAALASTFTSYPGKVPGDTKLYLYLDPSRLISDSIWSWDFRQFGGWVPHQNVGYLWPTGPFYWLFDVLRAPDWIAHRSWIASLILIAGIGAYRLAGNLGLSAGAAFAAGFAYQFSPYVLPYISRTSALLIPWSLLPWIIVVVSRYAVHRRRADLAIFVLLIASSGGLNATALLVVAPGPLIWLLHMMRRRGDDLRERIRAVLILGLAALAGSTWWLFGLFIQGRFGASVLSYSEALVSTSATSSSPEVLRGLGYWLFYDRGPAAPLTTASAPYQSSVALLVLGSLLVVASLIGISRSGHWRRPLSSMMFIGAVIAIGAHPFDDPSPLFRLLTDHPQNALSLALRSSTRAVPLVVLSLAVGLGFAVGTLRWQGRARQLVHVVAAAAIMGNLPAAWNGDLVDRSMVRPEQIPPSWKAAAQFLDSRFDEGFTGAVLLLPGIESAAYRWGYPVDAILPGISRKPLLTREWLPLGSPPVMDLLYALDDSFQNGTPATTAIAPVARMLGADTVMFVTSHQYERFGSANPSRALDAFDPPPQGLTPIAQFGEPSTNESSLGSWSEERVAYPSSSIPEILLYSVDEAPSSARLHAEPLLLAADGTGLVDLAESSDLHGLELALAEAFFDEAELAELSDEAAGFVITDSNRRRAHHWRSSQEVWGATEPLVGVVDQRDDFDSRLPIHPDERPGSDTAIEPVQVEATATAYGAELRYHPEYRPRAAVDGDLSTAWRLGPDRDPVGHVLTLRAQVPLSSLKLVQPLDEGRQQWITAASISIDGSAWIPIDLDRTSLTEKGQTIRLPTSGTEIRIRIDDVNLHERYSTSLGVGFAEVIDSSLTAPEVVRVPERMTADGASPLLYSLNRLRSDPFDRWRADPEQTLVRRLPVAMEEVRRIDVEVRLDPRASDDVLASQLGVLAGTASHRLNGSASWWGPSAFDGDVSTSWWGPSAADTRAQGHGAFSVYLNAPATWIEFAIDDAGGDRAPSSRAKEMQISFFLDDDIVERRTYIIPPFDANGRSRVDIDRVDSDRIEIAFTSIEEVEVVDAFTGKTIPAPLTFGEIFSDAWRNSPLPTTFDTGCRTDLLELDDRSIPLRIRGRTDDALRGEPFRAELCTSSPMSISAGSLIRSNANGASGWNIDRIRLGTDQSSLAPRAIALPTNRGSRVEFSVQVPRCERRCAVELPFGYSSGWQGRLDGIAMGSPSRTASGRSVWFLEANRNPSLLDATWAPQTLMWVGMAVSALAVAISIAVLAVGSFRRRSRPRATLLAEDDFVLASGSASASRARIALFGGFSALLSIGPAWGALTAVAFLVLNVSLLRKLAVAGVAVGYLFVVLQQMRIGAVPGFSWPSVFERAHAPLMTCLLIFTITLWPDEANPSRSEATPRSSDIR